MNDQEIIDFLDKHQVEVHWNSAEDVAQQCVCELQKFGEIPWGDGEIGLVWNGFGLDIRDAVINNHENLINGS